MSSVSMPEAKTQHVPVVSTPLYSYRAAITHMPSLLCDRLAHYWDIHLMCLHIVQNINHAQGGGIVQFFERDHLDVTK